MAVVAMNSNHIIEPFYLTGMIAANVYMEMLRTEFIPAFEERRLLFSCHFQQDGAQAHTTIATREFLNAKFPDRWVGKYGPIA